MKITYDNFTFDDKVIQAIEDKCSKVGAHTFNGYLHEASFGGKPIIQVLKDIKEEKDYQNCNPKERNLDLSLSQQQEIVIKFYKSLSFELGKRVETILTGKDSRYCVNITLDTSKDCCGNVSTKNGSNLIHIDINLDGGLRGLRILAHEMSHAISGFKTKAYDVINNRSKQDFDNYFRYLKTYQVDSIAEIESHIIESLFLNYLDDQKVIQTEDVENYENKRNNLILNNIKTVLEESYIFDHITPPITPEKFKNFERKIGGLFKSKNYQTIMNRFINMYQRDEHSGYSQYDFRYIVGDVVSSVWFEQYSQSSEKQKQQMLKSFEEYLLNTDTASLKTACSQLVGLEIGETFNDYICSLQAKMFER